MIAISNDPKYVGCVFTAPGIYFVICNSEIREISNDASSSPKGGWFPNIVTGPSEEESECLAELMDSLGFDKNFFRDYLDDCFGFDEEEAEEYFEDDDDKDYLKTFESSSERSQAARHRLLPWKSLSAHSYGMNWIVILSTMSGMVSTSSYMIISGIVVNVGGIMIV